MVDKMYLRIPAFDKKTLKKIIYELPKEGNISEATASMTKELRDNLMIDIEYAILTSLVGSELMFNPGTFDTLKKMSRIATITEDLNLLRQFTLSYGLSLKDYDKIYEKLMEQSLDLLNDFLKNTQNETCPLTPQTFVYNHQQNMVGKALVGIYANGSSIHAKMQDALLAIVDSRTSEINGRVIKKLDNITNDLGELILANIALCQNASVDNVKDPVLAKLLLNTSTADTMLFMLRAGLSIEEASLLFLAPLKGVDESLLGGITKYLTKSLDFKPTFALVTSLSMLRARIDANVYKDFFLLFTLLATVDQGKKFSQQAQKLVSIVRSDPELLNNIASILGNALSVYFVYDNFSDLANKLKLGNRVMKADSPNNAISPSIAGAIAQETTVRLFEKTSLDKMEFPFEGSTENTAIEFVRNGIINPEMSKAEMRKALMSLKIPSLLAFYSLGIELPLYCINKWFILGNTYLRDALDKVINNSKFAKTMKDKDIQEFFSAYIKFALSKTHLFGDNFDVLRSYYLHTWPQRFSAIVKENAELMSNPSVRRLTHDLENNAINFSRGGKLTAIMKGIIRKDFNSLLYSDSLEVLLFAKDLFMYSYYHDGMTFGPNNFGYFFDSTFWSFFPEVLETIRNLSDNISEEEIRLSFLEMYLANNPHVIAPTSVSEEDDGKPIISGLSIENLFTQYGTYDYIRTPKGNLYRLDPSTIDGKGAVYRKIPIFNSGVPVYNANSDILEMSKLYYTDSKDESNVRITYTDEQMELDNTEQTNNNSETPSQEDLANRNRDKKEPSKPNTPSGTGKIEEKEGDADIFDALEEEEASDEEIEVMKEIGRRLDLIGDKNIRNKTIDKINIYQGLYGLGVLSFDVFTEQVYRDVDAALAEDRGECKLPPKFK